MFGELKEGGLPVCDGVAALALSAVGALGELSVVHIGMAIGAQGVRELRLEICFAMTGLAPHLSVLSE